MTDFTIKRAVRCGVIPIIGVTGKTSSGKTKSALLLARGIVGLSGKLCGIDTENGRMRHHADDAAIGGFDTMDFQPPFSPRRYWEAISVAITQGYKAVIVDSVSHEWVGEGGCLEMQAAWMSGKGDALKMLSWNFIRQERAPFLNLVLRCPVPLVLCFRVKDKVIMPKENEDLPPGQRKKQIFIEEDAPVSRKDLLYEMTVVAHCEAHEDGGGYFSWMKPGPDSLRRECDAVKSSRITVAHGEAIARWCVGTTVPSNVTPKAAPSNLKADLWKQLLHLDPHATPETAAAWLGERKIIPMGVSLGSLSQAQLAEALDKVSILLQERDVANLLREREHA